MHKTISPVEAKKIMNENPDAVIVDVREEEEMAEGYIEGAVLIPLDTVESDVENKIGDKEKTVLVYCRSGRRSAIACDIMDSLGYKNVYDFGGIIDWPFERVI